MIAPDGALAGGYKSTVKKWTRSGRTFTFDTMDANLIWHATLLNDDVSNAQSTLLAKKKLNLPNCDAYGFCGAEAKKDEGIKFFIGLYTQKELKDFSLEKSSTWKIALVGEDGVETYPRSIQQITITPTEKAFYPYLNRWSKGYIVEFPRTDLGDLAKLTLRSIVAESTLKWKLK